jgi:hypothetical protein
VWGGCVGFFGWGGGGGGGAESFIFTGGFVVFWLF